MSWIRFNRLALAILFFAQMGLSAPTKNTKPTAPLAPIVINPDNLRSLLLEKNISLAEQLNLVQQAKAKVNIARADLLPSLNLGAIVTGGVSFALSTVSILLPFLLPSHWFDLKESQALLDSQADGYYVAQLNVYSSVYSTYLTIISDMDLLDVLSQQFSNYQSIEDTVRTGVNAGLIPPSDLMQAQAQSQLAQFQVSQTQELLNKEKAIVREMLSLPLNQEITFEKFHVDPSGNENLDVQTVLDQSLAKAPEVSQLNSLISAAQYAKWSQVFSFLNSGALTTDRGTDGALGSLRAVGQVNFGFNYFPALALSNLNIEQLKLQKTELNLEQAQLVETTVNSFVEAKKQYDLAVSAQNNLTQYYQVEQLRFRTGLTDLLHVMSAGNNLTTALTNKIRALNDMDNLRLTLDRLLISGKFAGIRACKIAQKKSGWLGHSSKQTLDQACHL
jgi:outer membrane protein TolC